MSDARAKPARAVPPLAMRHRRLLRAGLLAAVLAPMVALALYLGAFGGAHAVTQAAAGAFAALSRASGLVVAEVRLTGRTNADRGAVLAAIGIARDAPILAVDLDRVRDRLQALGWVREARVARRLPDALAVDIVEREPFARWQHDGRLAVIDRAGVVITRRGLERFSGLPLVVGADAPGEAGHLIDVMASDPRLQRRVAAAVRVGERRWTLQFDNGVEVLLPESDAEGGWQRLSALQRERQILERDLSVIDLRLADRVFLRLPPDVAARVREPGEST